MPRSNEHPLSQAEFDAIYSRVPRLTVEIIVRNAAGAIYLTKRDVDPCRGKWNLPGGTVRFGEPLEQAAKRIAGRELGIMPVGLELKGYIEYPSHYQHGMDSPVGIVFEVAGTGYDCKRDSESSEGKWATTVFSGLHEDQDAWLVAHGYLREI